MCVPIGHREIAEFCVYTVVGIKKRLLIYFIFGLRSITIFRHSQGIYLSWLRRYHQKRCQPGDQTKDHSCQQVLLWSQWAIE